MSHASANIVNTTAGPHSLWTGKIQQWYWVLRREERGDEFEGAPLGLVVSPYKV